MVAGAQQQEHMARLIYGAGARLLRVECTGCAYIAATLAAFSDHYQAMRPTPPPEPPPACLAALGLGWGATVADVRHAYRRLVKQVHPDHAGPASAAAFRELRAQYEAALALVGQKPKEAAA